MTWAFLRAMPPAIITIITAYPLKSKKENCVPQNIATDNNQQIKLIKAIKQEKTAELYTQSNEEKRAKIESDLLAIIKKECKDCPVLRKIIQKV